ncbi:hypothetical protein APX70_200296 [Pseudomonas syringae pv. maculicola]|uniref:Uncharacterized protein n=1 Tax=Pseudomonas syringae pv. maculicola TaxID=59511 RepID=A0A3M2ZXM0_PSEYM|nr:hypothetical protein APX70_200296 [Pseudomonas syringae pv. maculicola]
MLWRKLASMAISLTIRCAACKRTSTPLDMTCAAAARNGTPCRLMPLRRSSTRSG